MNMAKMPTSRSAEHNEKGAGPALGDSSARPAQKVGGLQLPIETEIYLLPDGQVVVADMPAELAALAEQLGVVAPCSTSALDDSQSPIPEAQTA